MSLTIYPSHAYFLLAGLYLGKLTNLASDVIITGLVLYIVTPQIYTEERLQRAKNWCYSWFDKKGPVQTDQQLVELNQDQQMKLLKELNKNQITHAAKGFDFSMLPKIEVLRSPK